MTTAVREKYRTILTERLPHVIRTRKEYDERRAELSAFMLEENELEESGRHLDEACGDYLDLLVALIADYDRRHVRISKATPIEVLHELMEAREMKQADLARFTSSSGTASEIYHGKRPISVSLARKLAQHFNVSVAVFI
ncbi:MAG TPA: helix-turn-helix domain-containing protein [Candidatus Tumulicola sp.]|nr:helix-turn-helix domain-containing protein [Candidatus Tumulicola sp.]